MGRVTATITITNHIDEVLGERGFIPAEQIRCITIDNVLVDTGATPLCKPSRYYIISGCIGINITRNQDTAVPFPYN